MNFMGGSGRLRGPGGSRGDITPKGYNTGQLAQYTPEQNQLFKQQFSHLGPDSYLSRLAGGDEELFNEMEAPALQQFQGILGGIGSKFSAGGTGRGAMSSRRSSGFQNETTAAASNFAQQLQAQRQGLQRQAIGDLMGMSNTLLNQRPYERFMTQKEQKQPSGWGSIGGGILGGIGGAFFGMPVQGAMAGSALGSQF